MISRSVRADGLKYPHFGQTYSVSAAYVVSHGLRKRERRRLELTCVLPLALLDEAVVREALLADEGITRMRLQVRVILSQNRISKPIIPLTCRRRYGVLDS